MNVLAWELQAGFIDIRGQCNEVLASRDTDWASPELSSRAESCACGLGPSPVPLGSLAQSQHAGE